PRAAKVEKRIRPWVGEGLRELQRVGDTLWVLNARARRVLRLDARTGKPAGAPIELPGVPTAMACDAATLWVAIRVSNFGGGDSLLRYDTRSGALVQTLPV